MDDMQVTTGEPPQTKTIDPSGDVLLKIGPSGQPYFKLLVNSRVMSFASPVFAAMFGGHFAEGQDLSSARPREVSLPEDDPFSMEILCNIAHMKVSELPAEMEHTALAEFAILCDKYRCIDTVRSSCRVWTIDLLKDKEHSKFEKLLFVAYLTYHTSSPRLQDFSFAIMTRLGSRGLLMNLACSQ